MLAGVCHIVSHVAPSELGFSGCIGLELVADTDSSVVHFFSQLNSPVESINAQHQLLVVSKSQSLQLSSSLLA